MKRNTVFVITFIGVLAFFCSFVVSLKGMCSINVLCSRPHEDAYASFFFPFVPPFFFSLILFRAKEELFNTWVRFSKWWIPLSMLAILVAPSYSHDWMYSIDKARVAFFSSVVFVVISLGIILYKYTREKQA